MTDYSPDPRLSPAQTLALGDRPWYPRWSTPVLGIVVRKAGTPTDADDSVIVAISDSQNTVLRNDTAVHEGVGLYRLDLRPDDTDQPGIFAITWIYDLESVPASPVTYFEVGPSSPDYEALPSGYQSIVESIMVRLADLTDSPFGGPYLTTKVQANFGRNRIAQLMKIAVDRVAVVSQPYSTYDISGVGGPAIDPVQWSGLLGQATWVEVLKHLRRSYREQPTPTGANVALLDRSGYAAGWDAEIRDEQADLSSMVSVFKIAQMRLGRPRVLVAGGIFGTMDRRIMTMPAGSPRYWAF